MYWKEWFAKAFSATARAFGALGPKILPPLLATALLYLQFGMGNLTTLSALGKVALCLVESYVLAFAAIYLWNLVAVVPAMLKGRDEIIAARDRTIAELSVPPVRFEFQRLDFGNNGIAGPCVILSLKISSGDKPITLDDWELTSDDGKVLRRPSVGFDEAKARQQLRLEAGHRLDGFLQFNGRGDPNRQWVFSCKDHSGRLYRESLPKSLTRVT